MVQRKRRTEGKRRINVPGGIVTKIPKLILQGIGMGIGFYLFRIGAVLVFIVILYMIFPSGDPEIIEEEPVATPIAVEVLNGCGVSGVAAQMTEYLRLNHIDVLITEDADNSEYPETIIIGRDSQFDHTEIISQLTGITNLTPDPVAESTVNVTIIIGKDYKNFKPYTN